MTRHELLTPPGTGAIATVAVTGPDSWAVVRSLFQPANGRPLPAAPPPHRVWFGRLGGPGGDEVVLAVRAVEPEPWVEIHGHGGRQVVRWLVETLERHGVAAAPQRPETPWALLERAPTLRTAAILLDQCHGAYELAAGDPAALPRLADLAPVGRHLVAPWAVVIAGAPNAGKSTLLNALAGFQRSVTSPTAGTTRDVVTTLAALDGWPVELADTAGLRAATESLEASGIDLARRFLRDADLVVWLLDGAEPNPVWPGDADGDPDRRIVVVNKADRPAAAALPPAVPRVSAATGAGVPELIAAIVRRLVPVAPEPGEAVPYTPALADWVLAAARRTS